VPPTAASTAFGYVETAEPLHSGALRVVRFVEKPDIETAQTYVDTGLLWNAGMFVAHVRVLLDHLADQQPRMAEGLHEIAAVWDTADRGATLARVWPTLTRIAIDYAIAEPVAAEGGFAVIPADIGWDDIGDVVALAGLLAGPGDVRVLGESSHVLAVDATGLVAQSGSRTVTLLGVHDIAVIDTEDAVLVTTMADAQRVKDLVSTWRERGRSDLL
nr:mannose-1-phosphate guanylyltransferase [Propionibacteriales bacterium]